VARLIDERRDIALKLDVERYVRLISFRPGAIEFAPAEGAPADLAQRLAGRLKQWTGQTWLVAAQASGGAETLAEQQRRTHDKSRADALAEPFVQAVMAAFPGTELVEVRQMAAIPAPEPTPGSDDQEDLA
jgi:DNA polymerase-3 subunit gamma/tau